MEICSLLKICNSPGGSPRKGGRPALGSNLWRGRGRAEVQRATRFEAGRRDTAGCEAQARHVRVQARSCGEQLWGRLGAGRSRSGAGRSPQRDVGRTMGSLSRVVPWVGGEGYCLLWMKRIDNMLFNLFKGSREGKGGDNADASCSLASKPRTGEDLWRGLPHLWRGEAP